MVVSFNEPCISTRVRVLFLIKRRLYNEIPAAAAATATTTTEIPIGKEDNAAFFFFFTFRYIINDLNCDTSMGIYMYTPGEGE